MQAFSSYGEKKNYHKLTENVHCPFLIFCLLQEEIVVAKQESKFMFQLARMDALKRHLRESQTCRSGFSDTLNWNLRLSPLLLPTSQFPQTHKGGSSIAAACVVWGNGDVQSVLLHYWPRDSLLFNYLSDIILASSSFI